jgi:ABC-type transport system involved in cytochrome c biogenesis permease subunit
MAYLHARYTLEWRGRRAAVLAIVGFAAVIFTYVGVDFLLPQKKGDGAN